MRISQINSFDTKNYCRKISSDPVFNGVVLDKAIQTTQMPKNAHELEKVWVKLLNAVRNEKGLRIYNQKMYDNLMEFIEKPDYIGVFFYKSGINDAPKGTSLPIAGDKNDMLIALAKDKTGVHIKFNGTNDVRHLGYTDSVGDKSYEYYQAPNAYIDFHDYIFDDSDGGPRRISIAGKPDQFFKLNGQPDKSGIKNRISRI